MGIILKFKQKMEEVLTESLEIVENRQICRENDRNP